MQKNEAYDLILRCEKVLISDPSDPTRLTEKCCDIAIKDGRIAAIEDKIESPGTPLWETKHSTVLPGLIDSQVHFRDPGAEHKEDFSSGSLGAVLGGITSVFDMPNTKPNTSTVERFNEKRESIANKSYCDFALFAGATNDNSSELEKMENLVGCCGIKIFMGSSTGDLLVSEDEYLKNVLKAGKKMISVHCEDEETLIERKSIAIKKGHASAHPEWRNVDSALKATQRIVNLARQAGRKIHTLHITTAEEVEFLQKNKDVATFEILPQHLYFNAPDCYEKLGSYAQMNPPIRDIRHRDALRQAVKDGVVNVIASDHAPHTKEEKSRTYPNSPSGLTGVQTIVPVMLNFVNQGLLSLEALCCLMSINPAKIFGAIGKGGIYVGQDADFTVVDMDLSREVTEKEIVSKSGWTPYAGETLKGWPVATFIRGQLVAERGQVHKQMGQPIVFNSSKTFEN